MSRALLLSGRRRKLASTTPSSFKSKDTEGFDVARRRPTASFLPLSLVADDRTYTLGVGGGALKTFTTPLLPPIVARTLFLSAGGLPHRTRRPHRSVSIQGSPRDVFRLEQAQRDARSRCCLQESFEVGHGEVLQLGIACGISIHHEPFHMRVVSKKKKKTEGCSLSAHSGGVPRTRRLDQSATVDGLLGCVRQIDKSIR